MVEADDRAFMTRALFLAERGRGRTTPNPVVGAVVVTTRGVVVGQGAHLRAGGPHAEVVALDAAGGRARGATIYCTLEPCCHQGRTGPCVERIVQAGIARVVVATIDPNPRVAGAGLALLRARGLDVAEGVCADPARRQNAPFFTWVTEARPFVLLKAAVSQDGFVGRPDHRVVLTGARANQFFQQQRAGVDAIAVGAGTVLVDDPQLTARGAYRERPLTRVLFDWRGRIPATARVFSTLAGGPVIMVVSAAAAEAGAARVAEFERRGVIVYRAGERRVRPVLDWLAAREVVSLLVEGGPGLQAACRDEGLIDRVQFAVTPHVLGEGVPSAVFTRPDLEGMRWPSVTMLGRDALIEFDVHRPH
jgi:diaminohydroxyphosphoribosylaminopyrimidine deaminase/5-amino-6-(5-phosphoribosylamino)uracil reductase